MNTYEESVKREFLDEFQNVLAKTGSNKVYNMKMLITLKKMAREDIYPDGRFGDDDCCLWEMFRW